MKHCDKCKIDVRGEFERCPLCQNKLTGESTPYEFPKVQSFYEKYEKIFKFAILVTSSLSIISIAVNILLPQSGHWSLFVLFGVICFWLTTNICIKKRQVISQNIAAEGYNINIVRNMGQVYRLARLVGRLRYTDNIFMGNARIVRGNKDFKN